MANAVLVVGLVALVSGTVARAQNPAIAIAVAVLPLPQQLRDGATVVRLTGAFKPEVVRHGTNGMVCIADLPAELRDELAAGSPLHGPGDILDARCYRDSFMPVLYRAFQLGYSIAGPRVAAEITAGALRVPSEPTAGYRCLGLAVGYDAEHNTVDGRIECWETLHFPFRTASEVGFPNEPDIPVGQQKRTPYVMASGTYWSHLMIRHRD
jgi:hypothetical protein